MRAVKAKRLRKRVFGDLSLRDRRYTAVGHTIVRMVEVEKGGKKQMEKRRFTANEIRCIGKRSEYQAAKRGTQ